MFIPKLGIVFGRREFAESASLKLEPSADPVIIARVLEEILASGKTVRWLIPGHGEAILEPDLNTAVKRLNGKDLK